MAALHMNFEEEIGDGGFESSGGGTTVRVDGSAPILLDFIVFDDQFEDQFEHLDSSFVKLKKHASVLGYERFTFERFEKMEIYSLLKERLELWKTSSPVLVNSIEASLKGIDWRFTPHLVKSFYNDKRLQGAVYYSYDKGAWISAPIWNQLGDFSKIGLLIHEALRHASIGYDYRLSEDIIHNITYKIILTDPKDKETIDSKDYYGKNSSMAKYFMRQDQLAASKAKVRDLLLDKRVAESPKLRAIIENCINNLDSSKDLLESANALRSIYAVTLDVVKAAFLNQSASRIDDVIVAHYRVRSSKPSLKLMDTARSLEQITDAGSIGEKAIIKYIDNGENPYSFYELKDRYQLSKAVKILKQYHNRLLDLGVLIEAY